MSVNKTSIIRTAVAMGALFAVYDLTAQKIDRRIFRAARPLTHYSGKSGKSQTGVNSRRQQPTRKSNPKKERVKPPKKKTWLDDWHERRRLRRNGLRAFPKRKTNNGDARIDLMVVYTPDVAQMFGGEKGIKARINVVVFRSNKAFSDSKVKASLNLVHAGQVDYKSSGDKTDDLYNMSYRKTELKKQVAGLRKKYKADLVTLVTEKDGGGVGFLLNRKSPMPDLGFNVVCANSLYNWVLAHECGHNLGCHHDRGNSYSWGDPMDDYGYGQRFYANNGEERCLYRTIMAYAPGRRIGHFSNPKVEYNGSLTGLANRTDNAKVINETAKIVARNSERLQ